MGIAGPRLDRPSIIGDEGRPRGASLTVAAVVLVALVGACAVLLDMTGVLMFVATALTLFVTGMALLQRESFRALFGGHLCLHTGMLLLVGIAAFSAVFGQWLVTAAFAVSLVGIATAWADTLDEESFRRALSQGGRSYASALALGIALAMVVGLGVGVYYLLEAVVSGTGYVTSVAAFLGLFGAVAFVVAIATKRLPLETILADPDDEKRRERLDSLRRWLVRLAAGSVLLLAAVFVLETQGIITAVVFALPPLGLLVQLLASWVVVVPLVIVGVFAVLATAFASRVASIADAVDAGDYDSLANWSAATVLLVGFSFMLLSPFTNPVWAAVALLGQPVALGAVLFLPATLAGSYMARQASGLALSAAGLVFLGISANGLVFLGISANGAGVPTVVTFACIAGAVVVWDLATFGTGLTVELGHIPETRRLELYHAVLSIGVGVAVVLLLTAIDYVRQSIGDSSGTLPAATLALAGVLVLALVEWGR